MPNMVLLLAAALLPLPSAEAWAQGLLAHRPPHGKTDDELPPYPNFRHSGALVTDSANSDMLESSPFMLNDQMYMLQSRMGPPPWNPRANATCNAAAPAGSAARCGDNCCDHALGCWNCTGNTAYFCIYDLLTGAELVCPPSGAGHAFFSAIVDRNEKPERLWVFGSAWNRANVTAADNNACRLGYANNGSCYVGSWSTEDLKVWRGPSKAVTIQRGAVYNVGASVVPRTARAALPPGLPPHQAFMVLEAANSFAVNVGDDRDLSKNWLVLNSSRPGWGNHSTGSDVFPERYNNGKLMPWGSRYNFGPGCPTARFNADDGFYYVFGGGCDIVLARSKDLSAGSWKAGGGPRMMITGCTNKTEDCAVNASSGIARLNDLGFYSEFWRQPSNRAEGLRELATLGSWDWAANDADFCDRGGKAPTYFIYGSCSQVMMLLLSLLLVLLLVLTPSILLPQCAPRGWKGPHGNFYNLGVYNGTENAWLSSYYRTALTTLKSDDCPASNGYKADGKTPFSTASPDFKSQHRSKGCQCPDIHVDGGDACAFSKEELFPNYAKNAAVRAATE